jgi:hypothetical protein
MRKIKIEDICRLAQKIYYETDNLSMEDRKELFVSKLTFGNGDAKYHCENIWFCLVDLMGSNISSDEQHLYYKSIDYSLGKINRLINGRFVEIENERNDNKKCNDNTHNL